MMAIGRQVTGTHLADPLPAAWFAALMYMFVLPFNTAWWALTHFGVVKPIHSKASAQGKHPLELKGIAWMLAHTAASATGIIGLWEGLARSSAAVGSLMSRIEVVIAILLGLWLLREVFTRWHWLGFALTVTGMVLVRWTEFSAQPDAFAWLLLGALGFGVAEFTGKVAVQYWPVPRLVLVRAWLMFGSLLAYALLTAGPWPVLEPSRWGWLIASAILGPVLARNTYMLALSYLPVSQVVLLNQAQPLYAGIVGFIVLAELPTPLFYLGGAAIILGNITLILARAKGKPAAPAVAKTG